MRLAWHNIAHDRMRFLVTVAGITCATLLMIIQGSILAGFLAASSRIIDASDADLWIVGRGAACFEFPVTIERRFVELAHSVPGVAQTSRICTRIVQFRKTTGDQQLVTMIGADPGAGARFPLPKVAEAIEPESLLIDESSGKVLNPNGQMPLPVEINERRATVIGQTTGFSSFLGTPYIFTSYPDAARYADVKPTETQFILVRTEPGAAIQDVKRRLQERLPNADIWTKGEFARKAQIYWTSQTEPAERSWPPRC